ncbi:hypothetical protein D9757_007918 [Collybiopsis confluens]|uniref:DyP dimeric alpha+beta barrel domain-containing protein n=1 Tax=Collybiopsis confluens TaxID=2823264 RepID=A0A8H5HBS3_9AGAR|nr:hypothetical protein D9757_007918 [Collybiopsis confluens]
MAFDSHNVDESTGTVGIAVPAGIEVQVSITFQQTYRQIISETWLSDGLLKKEEFYASDHPEKSGDSTTPAETIERQLQLRFLYFIEGRQRPIPSEMLEVITESQGADSLALRIVARDESSSGASDIDMFARVTLYDPSSPAVEHGLGGATTSDEETTSNAEEPQDVAPDLSNIQAEIVPGLNKAYQYFIFFRFNKISGFRDTMKSEIIPVISTAKDVFDMLKKKEFPSSGLPNTDWEYVGCSVGFSSIGLSKLGLNDYLYDEAFHRGQKQDAKDLGDKGIESEGEFLPDWEDKYLEEIHGVFQITAHNDSKGKAFVYQLKQAFSYSGGIKTVLSFRTHFRPHPDTRNEHFGFRDGISKPEIEGYTFDDELPIRFPGSPVVDPGCLLMGRKGDLDKDRRPAWAVDGSFFVFRRLRQLVPEFNSFLRENGVKLFPSLTPEDAADKLGARMFGRWKSGTPIVHSPDEDDKSISEDNDKINNFQYPADQEACPFAAHTQKSYPRTNMPGSNDHLFRRASIPYGFELDASEISTSTTQQDRGLIFLCYQSIIERGFKYTQQRFNNPDFPFSPLQSEKPGHDAVLGSSPRYMTGANPEKPTDKLSIPFRFVEARGGEYFFMPSISTLNKIADE